MHESIALITHYIPSFFEIFNPGNTQLENIKKAFYTDLKVSRDSNDTLKKDIEKLAVAAADTGGSSRVDKLREGHALYMDERARHASQERAFEEARLAELDELEKASWARRAGHAEAGAALMSNTLQNLFIATGSRRLPAVNAPSASRFSVPVLA